jgi:hypothetical protein
MKPACFASHTSGSWPGLIRKLKAAGFVEVRPGKGSHLLLKHPTSGKEVSGAVHTERNAGRLGNRIQWVALEDPT